MTNGRPFRLVLAGQSLIERPLHVVPSAGSTKVRELIVAADLAITNLEVAIGAADGWPVRDTTSHTAPDAVLDSLVWFGFRGVALASNHAFDLGPTGIVTALDATQRRGMITAGTGHDATAAATAGIALIGRTKVAMYGVVAAQKPAGAHALDATDTSGARPGVNRLRVHEHVSLDDAQMALLDEIEKLRVSAGDIGEPHAPLLTAEISRATDGNSTGRRRAWRVADEDDVAALLRAVRGAAQDADVVVVYLHNHYWGDPSESTPSWVQELARRCIDEGASVVLGHGTPAMQGLELYRGHLIAYGLGSFVFHTRNPKRYDTSAWESVLVDVRLTAGGVVEQAFLHPIVHGCHPEREATDGNDGSPDIAKPTTRQSILARLSRLSAGFGTNVAIGPDGSATLETAMSSQ